MSTALATRQSPEPGAAVQGRSIDIGNGFQVLPDSPLPRVDGPTAKAYRAIQTSQQSRPLYALVCSPDRPIRFDLLGITRSVDSSILVTLVDHVIAPWPPENNEERMFLIFDLPAGNRLMSDLTQRIRPWSDERIIERFVRPTFGMLRDLSLNGVAHGAIQTTNLFVGDASGTSVIHGECLSAPPGFAQHALFEPIDRAQCSPYAKGPPDISDDLYALGVVIVLLMLGRNPLGSMTEEQMILQKLDYGTYPALIGRGRIANTLVEPLRGLLQDQRSGRWTLRELEMWLNGRRLSPKQVDTAMRASRPYRFDNRDIWTTRSLAASLAQNETGAYREISSGRLDLWLRRAAASPRLAEQIEASIAAASNRGRSLFFESQVTARVLLVLDPMAPIRYRGLSVLPGGLGHALYDAVTRGRQPDVVMEILASQFASQWYAVQPATSHEALALVRELDRAKTLGDRAQIGFGVERALYELNPYAPCLSPLLKGHYAASIKTMILALEAVAKRPNRPKEPMDRHLAAFIATREKAVEEWLFKDLAISEPDRRALAILRLLASCARQAQGTPLPNLTAWCREVASPLIDSINSRRTRERLDKTLAQALNEGSLSLLHRIVADPTVRMRDKSDYVRAQQGYLLIHREIERLNRQLANPKGELLNYGRFIATILSGAVATLAAGVVVLAMGVFG